MQWIKENKHYLILGGILIILSFVLITLSGCASCSREVKTMDSDMSGGLDRTVTLYDYNGNKIQDWSGTIDIWYDDGRTLFDLNGKRTQIVGGIVVVQEN